MPQPIERCRRRKVRARMLVHRRLDAARLVAHYRAQAPGRVTIRFHVRKGENRKGRFLGAVRRQFRREGIARLSKRLPPQLMRRLRAGGRGFIAEFAVAGEPGYCAQAFRKDLTIRRLVSGQQVWFQSDSARAELPRRR